MTTFCLLSSVFRTSHRDVNINETSSYVDLAPLYGNNQEDQDKVRIRDGRGKLHPDAFAEDRLLLLPPAVCALLVLFSRNHNVSVCISQVPTPADILWISTLLLSSWRSMKSAPMLIRLPFQTMTPSRKNGSSTRKKIFSKLPDLLIVAGLAWVRFPCRNIV